LAAQSVLFVVGCQQKATVYGFAKKSLMFHSKVFSPVEAAAAAAQVTASKNGGIFWKFPRHTPSLSLPSSF
jgi:hypothetical protein